VDCPRARGGSKSAPAKAAPKAIWKTSLIEIVGVVEVMEFCSLDVLVRRRKMTVEAVFKGVPASRAFRPGEKIDYGGG
jgi:hypothetical protein